MCSSDLIMTEIAKPTVVRHTVAYASAVFQGVVTIEGVTGVLCQTQEHIEQAHAADKIAVVIDPEGACIQRYKPSVVIDAIIAKYNRGTKQTDAPVVIGVGPGFTVGEDCHYIVETKRGHYLGRVITEGCAIPNTGIPGEIGGYTKERIIRSPKAGLFKPYAAIGDYVHVGETVAYLNEEPILSQIEGTVRGMLFEEMQVSAGFKCGDIDPRGVKAHCFSISDKSRSVAGGALEAVMRGVNKDGQTSC